MDWSSLTGVLKVNEPVDEFAAGFWVRREEEKVDDIIGSDTKLKINNVWKQRSLREKQENSETLFCFYYSKS